jgi:predicted RecA/RadA family phage recombinase
MSLPASENTTTLRQGYVKKEGVGDFHQKVVNAGSAINQGDFCKFGRFFGIADEDIAATTGEGTIHVAAIYIFGAAVTGTSQTFYTENQDVFYDTSDGKFYEADAGTTRHLVGVVTRPGSASEATVEFKGIFPTIAFVAAS